MNSLFQVPTRASRVDDKAIANKSKKKLEEVPTTIKGSGSLFGIINNIKASVSIHLGKFADDYIIISTEEEFAHYIDRCISNNVISVDTETTGLDPMLDEIVGLCIYTPGEKAAYVPIHHKSYITQLESENQLSVEIIKRVLNRAVERSIDVIMFNATFDTRVIKNQLGVDMKCTWDCYLAARLLNENEGAGNNGLKQLHNKYCLDGKEDAFSFGDLFNGVTFDYVPIKYAYIYAAHDAIITYELYQFQRPFLTATDECCISHGLKDVAWVFHNIEMPCVEVTSAMEDNGVTFDMEYNAVLHEKYHKELEKCSKVVYNILDSEPYASKINTYRVKHLNSKLSDPINIDSPTQVAIVFYDIMQAQPVDKNNPRGTGEEILASMGNELANAILDYRGVKKLITTYIDKLPRCVNKNDGKIHCKFNQYGADTGRYSSNDPNLQNIPSHNKDIRKMFTAEDGNVLMSSDFSQQEPKCLAALCRQQGDSQMYNTFMAGKDLYSEIASKAFGFPYEECREFREDGTTNKEGKERRSQAKSILLGVLYGRGVDSIAEQLGTTPEKAREIKESVFRGFPAIKQFEQDSLNMVKAVGYVTTVCGRKRRLPSMMLPDFDVKWKDGVARDDDPLNFDDDTISDVVPDYIKNKWLIKLAKTPFKYKRRVFEEANNEGLWIIDNTKYKDTTKVVNARIQGSAADLTKLAMIELHRNKELRELGFKLLIPVHDEVIAECPQVNAKKCAKLLAETMSKAAEEILDMPIKCDVEVTKVWYGESIEL